MVAEVETGMVEIIEVVVKLSLLLPPFLSVLLQKYEL
jgi:hypothetical protein